VITASPIVTGESTTSGRTTAPVLQKPVPTADGFTFKVTNYAPTDAYVFLAEPGVEVSNADGDITISGLDPGRSATITVESYRDGKLIGKTTITGTALEATSSSTSQNGSSQPGTSSSTKNPSPGRTSSDGAGTNAGTRATGTSSGATNGSNAANSEASLLNLSSGKGGVSVGAHENTVQVKADALGVTIGNRQVGMTLHPSGGTSISGTGNVQLFRGGSIYASGYGLAPGSTATVTLYSPEISIASATVASNGTFTLHSTLPSGLSLGHHTLIVRGVSTKHQPVELGLGLNVAVPPVAPSPFPLRPLLAGIAGAIVLAGAGWFLIAWRRRREEEEEPALLV
jgi:hypothetical protein